MCCGDVPFVGSAYKVAHLSRSLEERSKVFVEAFGSQAKYFDGDFDGFGSIRRAPSP